MRYKHPIHRKSLLHFDFPYFGENGDGLRDEIGLLTWTRQGNAKLVGVEEPLDENVAGTPKFGYRCLQTASNTDFISASSHGNVVDILSMKSDKAYEFECFVRPMAATAGNIIAIRDAASDLFVIGKNTDNKITVTGLGVSLVSVNAVPLNAFTHVLVRLSGAIASVFIGGVSSGTASGLTGSIAATEIRLGGIAGQIDEFMFSHRSRVEAPMVPTHPYQGMVDYRSLGGFGNAKHGNIDFIGAGTDLNINTYAIAAGISGKSVVVGSRILGMFGDFEAGDEVLIHQSLKQNASSSVEEDLGRYSFRRLKSVSGSTLTLEKAVDEFTPNSGAYIVQVIKVPNFGTFSLPEDITLKPPAWDPLKGGGIVAFKTKGNCTIQGKILTTALGPKRTDSLQLTHTDIIDRFILTGNVFAMCGGLLAVSNAARIGSDFDGGGLGGEPSTPANPPTKASPGLVGYGGDGGKSVSNINIPGGEGGKPGFGGEGGDPSTGSNPLYYGEDGKSAPNIILIAKTTAVAFAAVSTGGGGGGGGGNGGQSLAGGGGGGAFEGKGGIGQQSYSYGGDGASFDGVGKPGLATYPGGNPGGAGYGGAGGSSLGGSGGGGTGTGFCFIAETGEA